MAKGKNTPKKADVKTTVVETENAPVVEEVKTEKTPDVATPKKKTPKKADSFNPDSVSQSTRSVSFEWSKGNKSGTKETMSENVAEIMEYKGLGKKVK